MELTEITLAGVPVMQLILWSVAAIALAEMGSAVCSAIGDKMSEWRERNRLRKGLPLDYSFTKNFVETRLKPACRVSITRLFRP